MIRCDRIKMQYTNLDRMTTELNWTIRGSLLSTTDICRGVSRSQNSVGESCANASFFGRTSSPIREKDTRRTSTSRTPTPPIQFVHVLVYVQRISSSSKKIIGSNYCSKGIFIRRLCKLTCKLKPRARKEKEVLLSLMFYEMFCNDHFIKKKRMSRNDIYFLS